MRILSSVVIVVMLFPVIAIAQTVGNSDIDLGSRLVSDEFWYASIVAFVTFASTVLTAGIKSKGWNPVVQYGVDLLNLLAGNVFKNKNKDAE